MNENFAATALTDTLAASSGSNGVGFIQSGAGAVARTAQNKMREIVTPYDFGAVGDGVTDDTAAVQAALSSTAMQVYLAPGLFRVSSTVTSSVANRTINGPGALTATTPVAIAMTVTGNYNTIAVNIVGNNQIGVGIRIQDAVLPIVNGGRIRDLYSSTANCAGLYFADTQSGAVVQDVVITNVNSPGNGTLGDGSGFSRGIAIGLSGPGNPTGDFVIKGCHISNIIGEEGDAIAAGSGGGGTYYRLDLTVTNNVIRGFTRRAVKTQGNHVRVIGNSISNDWTSAGQVPNAINVIDFVQGGDCVARDNDLYNCNFFAQVAVFAQDAEVWNNFLIAGNTFWGLTSSSTSNGVTITQSGSSSVTSGVGLIVRDNVFSGGAGRAINLGKCTSPVISGNVISVATEANTRTISLNSAVTNAVILDNVMTSGERQSFVAVDGPNSVVANNHVKTNTPLFANATLVAGRKNHLVAGNSIDGTSSLTYDADTLTGNRFGGNYNFGAQTVTSPGPLFLSQSAGPATVLAGLQVRAGQIVFDTTPTAAGKIGWTALTSGAAESVTWQLFGPIDA